MVPKTIQKDLFGYKPNEILFIPNEQTKKITKTKVKKTTLLTVPPKGGKK